jgi:hypothetical protein
MTRPLVMLTLAAAIAVAAVAATGRAQPTAARAGFPGAQPSATPAGQVTLYGHIAALTRLGDRAELRFDPAWLTKGLTAQRASGMSSVPNDSYVVEGGHRLLTYVVAPNARITVLTNPGTGPVSTPIKLGELIRIVNRGAHRKLFEPLRSGVWIRVWVDTIRAIDQQYQP